MNESIIADAVVIFVRQLYFPFYTFGGLQTDPTGRSGLPVSKPSSYLVIGNPPLQSAAPFTRFLSDIMNTTVSPAVKRRACVACTAAKAKCTPQTVDLCQRCARLGKSCTYLDLPQTRRKNKAAPRYFFPANMA